MKCKNCSGNGHITIGCDSYPCDFCHGTGKVEQTEQEYLQSCDTEQLAEFINDVSKKCYTCGEGYTAHPAYCPFHKCLRGSVYGITEWLKQPHTKGVAE